MIFFNYRKYALVFLILFLPLRDTIGSNLHLHLQSSENTSETLNSNNATSSIARKWNEVLLEAIRNDFARPTVHARNLFHISAAMYDAWAIFSETDKTYLIGNDVHGFSSGFLNFQSLSGSIEENRIEAISYTVYRLIKHRFALSPGNLEIMELTDSLFQTELGFDPQFTSEDYTGGSSAALGNYIAKQYIQYGLKDGSNEQFQYENQYYQPVNNSIDVEAPGNPDITDPNRWQPIRFEEFIDQSGNVIPGAVPEFLGPEWGWVLPFSLSEADAVVKERDGNGYKIYYDPGPPPLLDTINGGVDSDHYKWNFSMVATWSSHLDASIDEVIDISPASIGNFDIDELPGDFDEYPLFYDYINGGDASKGRSLNPATGQPYEPQMVKLGDYARILAEFWADGPDSETPPGHWFTILNYVNSHPELLKKMGGEGEILNDLEWDVKTYFMLGGTMHDVAITAWGIKGYYDYIRPVSAIRYMADKGQSSDNSLPNYHIAGIPLVDGFIETVNADDPLVGDNNENLNKIKLHAWKGPEYVDDPESDVAGVDWILAENWWPYQRPSFITPPFAGFVSGHSTFSRAAAELLTRITGTPYFPGGLGEFETPKNEFLVFEEGPSEDITLQWATYRDASDQCSLSRIWGGIHPPVDDLPGRKLGKIIGNSAFEFAMDYFNKPILSVSDNKEFKIFPNPTSDRIKIEIGENREARLRITNLSGIGHYDEKIRGLTTLDISDLNKGIYLIEIRVEDNSYKSLIIVSD